MSICRAVSAAIVLAGSLATATAQDLCPLESPSNMIAPRLTVIPEPFALPASVSAVLPRSTVDRPDTSAGKQVHVMYVLPSDRPDRSLDTNGTLENSVNSFQSWLSSKTGGQGLRLDRYAGSLDVTFFRLVRSDATMASYGGYVRDQIEADLDASGFNAQNKIYAVYYDGTSTTGCGGGAWPPTLPGNVGAIYLNGQPSCSANPLAAPGGPPGYLDFGMLHEIIHVMGIVATCAPNHTRAGHVSDNANDLMWAGDGVWVPSGWANVILDYNNNDYFRHSNPSCLDLEDTGFLDHDSLLPNLAPYQPPGWSDKVVVSRTTGTNIDTAPLAPTDSLYLDWAVANDGIAATGVRFFAEIYIDGVLRETWYTDPPINPSTYTVLPDYAIGSLSSGTHTIRIRTDATNAIAEANEADNEYTKTITVGGGSPPVCTSDAITLCENGGRFQVRAIFSAPSLGISNAPARAVPLTSDTGYFWFFSSNNVELFVKVVDGRAVNGYFWVFAGGLTNVSVTVTVTDTQTGLAKVYRNSANTPFQPIQDTAAF